MNFINGVIPQGSISINNSSSSKIEWGRIDKQGSDTHVKINSKLNLIEGYKFIGEKEVKTGNLYNKHIICGDFFKIPVGHSQLILSKDHNATDIEYYYYYY